MNAGFPIAGNTLDVLRTRFRSAGLSRGWSFDWPERSGYAHGELSELVEAVRGKRGDVVDEAADVLLTALCGLVPTGVPMSDVLNAAFAKVEAIAARRVGVDANKASVSHTPLPWAWDRGEEARRKGEPQSANPYPAGIDRALWDSGWEYAG